MSVGVGTIVTVGTVGCTIEPIGVADEMIV
jgi:hypothetical protein